MFSLNNLLSADRYVFHLINDFAFEWSWIDALGIFFAKYLIYLMVVILLLPLLKSRHYWKIVAVSLISAVIARGFTSLIRLIYFRARPFNIDHVNLLIEKTNESSFPSGHASFAFGLATIVFLNNKKWGVIFFVVAFLVSLGRVFAGVHWPLDVLAGALVGILSGWLINKIFKKLI